MAKDQRIITRAAMVKDQKIITRAAMIKDQKRIRRVVAVGVQVIHRGHHLESLMVQVKR